MPIDLYNVLGVSRDCSQDDIKRAYRSLALRWHPDKNQHRSQEADMRFREISEAYKLLSDPQKRVQYDRHGITGDETFNPGTVFDMDDAFSMFEDMFSRDLFSGDSMFSGFRRRKTKNGNSGPFGVGGFSGISSFLGGHSSDFFGNQGGMSGFSDMSGSGFGNMINQSFQSTSYNSSNTGFGGVSVSQSTSSHTRNGETITVTETIKRYPDGREERDVKESRSNSRGIASHNRSVRGLGR